MTGDVLLAFRRVVHLPTNTVVGWRVARLEVPTEPHLRAPYYRRLADELTETLLRTDGGRRSLRFMAVEADVDEAGELADHLGRVVVEHGLPGPRFGMVFPGTDVVARPELHPQLRRLVELDIGVGFCDPDMTLARQAIVERLPITRLRLHAVHASAREEARTADLIALARRHGITTTVTGIETLDQERIARRAGADMGTGDHLGGWTDQPELEVGRASALDVVQRVTGRDTPTWPG